MSKDQDFAPRCISLDLEVGKTDGRIHAFSAIRADTNQVIRSGGRNLKNALSKLDEFSDGASFVLGHNLIEFDLPHLRAVKPDLRLLNLPVVDTLRLNPLAFPANPYHHLVKHYQDGQLRRGRKNDPELDARLALNVFRDQRKMLREANLDLLLAWHWLTTPKPEGADRTIDYFFAELRGSSRPSFVEACSAINRQLDGLTCNTNRNAIMADTSESGWPLAYVLAWLSVSGGNSVIPPWVRHQFPRAGQLLRQLRDLACTAPDCGWCREQHDARKELTRWFGFPEYRAEPSDKNGYPLQQSIVEAAMAGKHVLGILPTGTGKSLCYQIPALSRYYKTGALTVVISPLVALMEDQVKGLEARGISSCVAINGLLSMPERADARERVRLGDAAILLVSPEQLRSQSLRRTLGQREIGAWVLDEVHCISRWGHDFRPDYRYVARFIREKAGEEPVPPVLCLTATAKPDVEKDIVDHFYRNIGIELNVFNGGAERSNLTFEVMPTSGGEKFAHIHQILMRYMPANVPGGAIVYCATRKQTEEVADFLRMKDIAVEHFHAKLPPEDKKNVQHIFKEGELRVITATNAFGMGIDKADVRLVIHADMPASLENYFQEAGRAGRDLNAARCVMLYTEDDVERQFGMSASSRLSRREIHGVLRALWNLNRKKNLNDEVVATSGEILSEDEDHEFEKNFVTDDDRVKVAISWLEESKLLSREENRVQIFPSSLRVNSLDEATARMQKKQILEKYRKQLLAIVRELVEARPDEGISTDELMVVSGLSIEQVRHAFHDLEQLGIASNDLALTAFLHSGVERSSAKRIREAANLEIALIARMREEHPDQGKGDASKLHLRLVAQDLRDRGVADPLPGRLRRILSSIAADGRGEGGAAGSLDVRNMGAETVRVKLRREWKELERVAQTRREAAHCLLEHLLESLPPGSRGTDLLAETTQGMLTQAIKSNLVLKSKVSEQHLVRLRDRALLWLHDQEVIRLHKGMSVLRPAMTIILKRERRGFTSADFEPLYLHYNGQILQIHVIDEYAKLGLSKMHEAARLAKDYFVLNEEEFLQRWMRERSRTIARQTTPESWRKIVESLNNPIQQRIVADNREQTNVLVLAGPGSGKTRVLVHRIAYLIRARRENARGVLALAYNRHAAVEIRNRLKELIGDDARGVTVLTCHALAMRLAGTTFRKMAEQPDEKAFENVIRQAVDLLRGKDLPQEEADEQRERLLHGFRWILVDEYQDINEDQYELISALAGRTIEDEAGKLTLFAVGDDDQNIYAFNNTSVEFIHRFETDYGPKPFFLTDNYRSTRHIISAANTVIQSARERMKVAHPIRIDDVRSKELLGGPWQKLDPVSKGLVQILPAGSDSIAQAQVAMAEFQRLLDLSDEWDWSRCAVIARKWEYLNPVRAFCQLHDIPVQLGYEKTPNFWRLRETRMFTEWLQGRKSGVIKITDMRTWLHENTIGYWSELLHQAVDDHELETGGSEMPVTHFIEWLAEWGKDARRRHRGLLLLTAHRAKGLEFDHVCVLDGGWSNFQGKSDLDEVRRLYYVAMTRARYTLTLTRLNGFNPIQENLLKELCILRRDPVELPPGPTELTYQYIRASLEDVDLGYAGRRGSNHFVHRAIVELSLGDSLDMRIAEAGYWELLNQSGSVVGRMAKRFTPPHRMRFRTASVMAISGWSINATSPEFRDRVKCDAWEVVLPELVFEPDE